MPLGSVSSSASGDPSAPRSQVWPTPLSPLLGRTLRGMTFQGAPTPSRPNPESIRELQWCRGVGYRSDCPRRSDWDSPAVVESLILVMKALSCFLQASRSHFDSQSQLLVPLEPSCEPHVLPQVRTRFLRIRQHVVHRHPYHVVLSNSQRLGLCRVLACSLVLPHEKSVLS